MNKNEFPVTYAAYVKYYNGEDSSLVINCADIPAALDMLKADLTGNGGITEGQGCFIEDILIKYGDSAVMFSPTDALNKDDKSGTLTIYFGSDVTLSKRESIELFIEDYELLKVNERGINYEPKRKIMQAPER